MIDSSEAASGRRATLTLPSPRPPPFARLATATVSSVSVKGRSAAAADASAAWPSGGSAGTAISSDRCGGHRAKPLSCRCLIAWMASCADDPQAGPGAGETAKMPSPGMFFAGAQAAAVFEKLAKHGRGTAKLSREEFTGLLDALAEDDNGQALLAMLVTRKKARRESARARQMAALE